MTLRVRIFSAIAVVVALTVGAGSIFYYLDAAKYLRGQLQNRTEHILDSLQVEVQQSEQGLRNQLDRMTRQTAQITYGFSHLSDAERYQWANKYIRDGYVDVVKLLDGTGRILSSGHWEASFGAIDPSLTRYQEHNDTAKSRVGLVLESTSSGSELTLEVWSHVRWGKNETRTVVLGRFFDSAVLRQLLARTDADYLALCLADVSLAENEKQGCVAAISERVQLSDLVTHSADELANRFALARGPMAASIPHAAQLWVGIDRTPLKRLVRDQLVKASFVSLAGLILALVLGLGLANHIGAPIARLAHASRELASGHLTTRVASPKTTVREVDHLVTSFNAMAEELEQYQRRAAVAERVATWQEIARGLAHELKNPLTPILAALQVVQRAREKEHPDFDLILQEQATAVGEEVRRLKSLADNFARFAQLPPPEPTVVHLESVVEGVVALYASGHTSLEVDLNCADGLPAFFVDEDRLRTVLTNLVKNAIEAMEGDGTLMVRVMRNHHGGMPVVISVEDTGPGIDPSVLDRLFTPYVTTKGSEGTGLGLALAYRIVTEMGGGIAVERPESGGARFVVTLPLPVAVEEPT